MYAGRPKSHQVFNSVHVPSSQFPKIWTGRWGEKHEPFFTLHFTAIWTTTGRTKAGDNSKQEENLREGEHESEGLMLPSEMAGVVIFSLERSGRKAHGTREQGGFPGPFQDPGAPQPTFRCPPPQLRPSLPHPRHANKFFLDLSGEAEEVRQRRSQSLFRYERDQAAV